MNSCFAIKASFTECVLRLAKLVQALENVCVLVAVHVANLIDCAKYSCYLLQTFTFEDELLEFV